MTKERPILFGGEMVRAILAGRKTQTRRPVKGLRVCLRHEVASELPGASGCAPPIRAAPGVYAAKMNLHGAVAIELPHAPPTPGVRSFLGVKPQEFDFVCPYAGGHTYLRRHPDGRMAWHLQVPEGQRLWVRETHQFLRMDDGNTVCAYRASCEGESFTYASPSRSIVEAVQVARWRPAIHMPHDASRLTLEVTGVRVERLDAITEADASAEGMLDVSSAQDGGSLRATFRRRWGAMYGVGSPFQRVLNPWVWVVEFRCLEAA